MISTWSNGPDYPFVNDDLDFEYGDGATSCSATLNNDFWYFQARLIARLDE